MSMLQRGESTPQLQQWFDRLAPVVEEARARLRRLKPGKLAMYSGCEEDADSNFRLTFFWQEYVISGDDFTVRRADTGDEPSSFTQSLILTYLATADGTTPSSRWVGFRELPDGLFYVQAFQGYTGGRLVRELGDGIETFRRAAGALGGEPLEIGDAGYVFTVLPRVHLGLVYWEGDEEFPSQARVLFEDTAARYMPTDGLAILGSQLVGRMLKAARGLS
ncbi:MAG: DUF3786 domain-containing protein [Anaerolineae bacterium]|nr:DUF3786 domain-containing protein [Anaerolineae bacterium]